MKPQICAARQGPSVRPVTLTDNQDSLIIGHAKTLFTSPFRDDDNDFRLPKPTSSQSGKVVALMHEARASGGERYFHFCQAIIEPVLVYRECLRSLYNKMAIKKMLSLDFALLWDHLVCEEKIAPRKPPFHLPIPSPSFWID